MTTDSSNTLDPRRHAYRDDLAAVSLRGRVTAKRYTAGQRFQVVRASVPLRRKPAATVSLDTEALFGEMVTIYDTADGWAWGQLAHDGYVGYLPADSLSSEVETPTHRVRALGTFLYPSADMKSPPLMHLSVGSLLTVADRDERFSRLAKGGFVISRHISEAGRHARDFVDVAEQFVGTPYLWGGRTRIGLDCSGLVQLSLSAAGFACPRDTDMQQQELGTAVPITASLDDLRRGDFVFWKGHVGIMIDGVMLLHANAHHMATVVEPLPEAVQRIGKTGSKTTAVRRLDGLSTSRSAA